MIIAESKIMAPATFIPSTFATLHLRTKHFGHKINENFRLMLLKTFCHFLQLRFCICHVFLVQTQSCKDNFQGKITLRLFVARSDWPFNIFQPIRVPSVQVQVNVILLQTLSLHEASGQGLVKVKVMLKIKAVFSGPSEATKQTHDEL